MPADALTRLAHWFAAHCDGEREHHHGVSLTSLDNPGWWIKIDLTATELAGRSFAPMLESIGPGGHPAGDRWLHCRLEGNVWNGTGDETRLKQIIEIFLDWAEGTDL
jgi:hypothetical protein